MWLTSSFLHLYALPLAVTMPRVSVVRYALPSPELARHGQWPGGDEGNRTLDPLLAGQVLSQLSYTPIFGYSVDLSVTEN